MKRLFFLNCALLVFLTDTVSQTEVFTSFNSTHAGRNISVTASGTIKKTHEIGGGVRFNINQLSHPDDQNKVFFKRLYATEPIHFFGLEAFYHRFIFKKWKTIHPFLFYDVQVTYSTTRNRSLLPHPHSRYLDGTILYKEHLNNFGPFTWLEQNIGFGFKLKLFSNVYLQQKLGFGTSFIMGYEKKLLGKYFNWFDWDFGYLISIGMGYRFGQVKNKRS